MKIRDRIKDFRRVPASELRPHPRNWRTHPQAQADALRGVLSEVGMADAVIARELEDGTLQLVDGHLRVETMGTAMVPVLVLDVDEAEADKLLVSLDPLAGLAGRDDELLRGLLETVKTDSDALQAMLDGLLPSVEELEPAPGPDPGPREDKAAELQRKWGTSEGQLWSIGRHRLFCGDSTVPDNWSRLMAGARASLCVTSPPYAQQRDYTQGIDDWTSMMCGVFGCVLENLDADASALVNLGLVHDDGEVDEYWSAWKEFMRSQGWPLFGWYVWDQMYGLPGDWNGRMAPSHEFVFHFSSNPRRPNKTIECAHAGSSAEKRTMRKKDGTTKSFTHNVGASVQSHKIPDSVIRLQRQIGGIDGHPAPFPVELPQFIVEAYTDPGAVVIEPFCGSGTTMVACEQEGRVCYGMELSPEYCAVILERLTTMGLEAALLPADTEPPAQPAEAPKPARPDRAKR